MDITRLFIADLDFESFGDYFMFVKIHVCFLLEKAHAPEEMADHPSEYVL